MDQNNSVKLYGLISLANNPDPKTSSFLAQIIRSSKDVTGKMAAELLAQHNEKGHQLLRELSLDEGSVCRRNVIYGLRLIPDEWAVNLLKKINSVDKVWIIRDAAAITLENKWDPVSYAPRPLHNPADDPKMLRIASEHGQGIPAKSFPTDFLKSQLHSNKYGEALLAIQYLVSKPNLEALTEIKNITGYENPMREVASQALFEIGMQS